MGVAMKFYGAPELAGNNARRGYAEAMVRELGPDALQIINAAVSEPGATDRDRAELLAISLEIRRVVRGTQREAA